MKQKLIFLCAGLMLTACSKGDISLNGRSYQHLAENGTIISLDFMPDENRVAGAVVNRYFGPYEQNKNAITFGPIGSTMMMGPREEMQVESNYLQFLHQVNQFQLKDNTLILKTPDGQKMIFTQQN